ncbi:MAG: hypothetical protein BWK79_19590 [Beggiatoa sp. IS2]|nr:MAG: hypothetical protein BWK79_19590 [Beggiatoa sp. IS2]
MNNNYQLIFAHELGINPAEFVETWNAEHRELAEAQTMATQRTDFTVEPTAMTASAILISFALGIGVHAVYDLVKHATIRVIQRKSKSSTHYSDVELQEIPQPDGSRLLIVKIKEKTTEIHRSESQK